MPMSRGVLVLVLVIANIQGKKVAESRSEEANKTLFKLNEAKKFSEIVDDNDYVAVVFHGPRNLRTDKILKNLENLNLKTKHEVIFLRVEGTSEARAYGLDPAKFPSLLLFDKGIPEQYPGDMSKPLELTQWMSDEIKRNDIDDLDPKVLRKVVKKTPALVVLFTDGDILNGQDEIRELCDSYDIAIGKMESPETAVQFGIDKLPAVVYFENEIPSVYGDTLDDTEAILEWLEEQRTSDTIEKVSEEILQYLAKTKEYVAVFFTGPCDKQAKTNQECERVLHELENIDDEVDSFGISLVTTDDIKYAGTSLQLRKFPALGMFRNGRFLLYEGPLTDEKDLLAWIIDEETLELSGEIEEVGKVMLKKILTEEREVVVFFYEELSRKVRDILERLDAIDVELSKRDIEVVKCSNQDVAFEEFGLIKDLPFLVLFERGVPIPYPSDANILDQREVYSWIVELVEADTIPSVEQSVLEKLIDTVDNLVVIFYDNSKKKQQSFLTDIESIGDEVEKLDMVMVKVESPRIAKEFDLFYLPAVVHFEEGIPNLYENDLTSEDFLHWLHHLQTENYIAKGTKTMIDKVVSEQNHVAVLFLGECEEPSCDHLVDKLERISDDLDKLGIVFLQTNDEEAINFFKIKSLPTIAFFRNGDMVLFEGNVAHEMSVLKFLTDIDNFWVANKIEEIDKALLEHVIKEEKDIFVFFYDENDGRARKLLKKLDGINDNLENDKTVLMKCSDVNVEDYYGIGYVPRLVYFEYQIPEPFVGNLNDEGEILRWVSAEMVSNEIKPVSRAILDHLIQKINHIGVLFVNNEDHEEMKLLNSIEELHDTLLENELVVVQIDDADYEKELGLVNLPTLVHFSDAVPGIFTGEEVPEKILQWLVKMRTEHVIEEVTKEIILKLIHDEEYLAVLFSGDCSGASSQTCSDLQETLEHIEDDLSKIGVMFVQTSDQSFASSEHQISSFPAIGLYRNGHFLQCDDTDFQDEDELRKWFLTEENLKIPGKIEDINILMLRYIYETDDKFAVFFYENVDRDSDEIVEALERIDEDLEKFNISLFKSNDRDAEDIFGIGEVPALVFVQNGIPHVYEGDMMNATSMETWLKEESNTTRIHEVTDVVLWKLIDKFEFIAAVFYKDKNDKVVENLKGIADDCNEIGIAIVKMRDVEEAKEYGITKLPQLVAFQNKIPSIMRENLKNTQQTLDWLEKKKTTSTIAEVTDEILNKLIETHEYVGVFFRGEECSKDSGVEEGSHDYDCEEVLAELETIDDDLQTIGILMVTTDDSGMAKDHGVKDVPAIGLFRNGYFIQYEGDESNEKLILRWMSDENTLKIVGIIDEVNMAMLDNILEDQKDAFVFFYDKEDTDSHTILEELEDIDEKLDKQDLTMVKISDSNAQESSGLDTLPTLVYFENGIPEVYDGDLLNDNAIMKWIKAELKEEEIKEISVKMLDRLVDKGKTLAVLFYDSMDKEDQDVLAELERIDDDCARFEINFVKVQDQNKATDYGLDNLPGLLYFENRLPSVYDGNLMEEEELLDWLIEQKTTDTIEQVTDEILERLIMEESYLSVFFSGPCEEDDPCFKILQNLEEIDSKVQKHGIMMVTTEERNLAKQYDLRGIPALAMFKNEEIVPYDGDLEDNIGIMEWLTNMENLKIVDKIEEVNFDMLTYFIQVESHVVVFFYREGNLHDKGVISRLEHIDDDLEEKKILLVKSGSKSIGNKFGIGSSPALVHFSNEIPIVFKEDINDEQLVMEWIFGNLKKEVIEEVSAQVLDYLIQSQENLLVVFFEDDEDEEENAGDQEANESEAFLRYMETVDDDCDRLSLPLVKVSDKDLISQYGLISTPSLVFFQDQIPGLYRGKNMSDFELIKNWTLSLRTTSALQLINDNMMEDIVETFDYVIVLLTGICKENNNDCKEFQGKVVDSFEEIQKDIQNLGFCLVMNPDRLVAFRDYNITNFPSLVLFRNGHITKFEDSLLDTSSVMHWLSATETLEISGVIEKVNADLLRHFVELEDSILVFFYDEFQKNLDDILLELETVDDNLENEAVEFVRCSDKNALADYGLIMWPSLVFFDHGVPTYYFGDLKNDDNILGWITKELQEDKLPDLKNNILESVVERLEFVAVLYYYKKDPNSQDVIEKLISIKTDAHMHDIVLVSVSDPNLVDAIGAEEIPALVYYENNIPFIYKGNVGNEKKVLEWLIYQRNVASIEEVTDEMLTDIIEENEFVAVLFLGLCSEEEEEEEEICNAVVQGLERYDSVLDEHGVVLVMTSEVDRAKELWISKFPSLVYFRNGDPVKFSGDLTNSMVVQHWLTSEKVLNLPSKIVKVNDLMLAKLIKKYIHLYVFFYEEGDVFAHKVLRLLEELEDNLEEINVNLVKICDEEIEDEYNLEDMPTLVYFYKGDPSVYYGDLKHFDQVTQWVESQKNGRI